MSDSPACTATYETAAYILLFGNPEPAGRAALIRYVARLEDVTVRRESDGSIVFTRPVRNGNPGDTYAESILVEPDGAVRAVVEREGLKDYEKSGTPAATPGVAGVPAHAMSIYVEMRVLEADVADRAPSGPTVVPSP